MTGRSLILDTTVRLVFDAALVLSIYLLFAGHNQPGGGFVGGLVAGAAIALRYIAGGFGAVRATERIRPWTFQAVGLILAAGVALSSLLTTDAPLDQGVLAWHVTGFGKVAASSTTVFDAGVYLIVVGLVLMVFEGLGDEPGDPDGDAAMRSDGPR